MTERLRLCFDLLQAPKRTAADPQSSRTIFIYPPYPFLTQTFWVRIVFREGRNRSRGPIDEVECRLGTHPDARRGLRR